MTARTELSRAESSRTELGRSLDLNGVTYRYRGGNVGGAGVGPLNLHVEPGEFLCVVGPSGSGKSTLLSLLAGFLRPQQGEIRLGGDPVNGPHPALTLVQQEAALFPWLTVGGNVAFGLKGVSGAEKAARVADALRLVGLSGYEARRPHELSGGQRQRVSIARALAVRPGLLLLDEPFSALDPGLRASLGEVCRSLLAQTRAALICVSHHPDELVGLVDRCALLDAGSLRRFDIDDRRPGQSRDQVAAALHAALVHPGVLSR